MVDLEAGPESPVVDAVSTDTPASETVSSSVPETPSTPLEDLYDFGPPGETTDATVAVAAPADAQAAPAPADAPTAHVISDALLQRATAMGYTPEVIASIKDPIQLEAVVGTAERVAMQAMHFARQQAPVQQTQQPVQAVQLPPAPVAPVFDENALRVDMASKNFDPSLIDAMVGMARGNHQVAMSNHQSLLQQHNLMTQRLTEQSDYNAKAHQYMQQQDQRLAQIQQQHQRELIDRDYTAFQSDLPEPVQKLVADPAARAQIMQTANTMLAGFQATGQQLPANSVAFKQAMYLTLGDKIHQASIETVRGEVRTHQARATQRPSSASGGSQVVNRLPPGPERAGAWIEDQLARLGMPNHSGPSHEV